VSERLAAEICVLGGGPAGAVAAWKLARLGHAVLIVERSPFPRPHVGAALSPGIWPQLDLLGLTDAVCAAGFRPTAAAVIRWVGDPEATRHPDPPGLMVDRGRFDRLLLRHAEAAGARVLQPASALKPHREAGEGGEWIMPLRTPEGGREVRARFLVDASGRAARLGGGRVRTGPLTLALHGTWARPGGWGEETMTEAGEDEWLWAAPQPDGALSAMAFVDAGRYRAARMAGISREALYRGLLARSALLAETVRARLTGGPDLCDATCWHSPQPVGEGFLTTGEAAFTLDPLSSTGVQKAMQTAWCGAIAVHTILSRPAHAAAAQRFYAEGHFATVARHAAWAAELYATARRHAGRPFWHQRAATAVPLPAEARSETLKADSGRGLRLSAAASLLDTPCIAGDLIETRRALAHPGLERPVAYLDGVEIAPLLETVLPGATLDELAAVWSRRLPSSSPRQAATLAAWLVHQGILVPA